jgi:aminoglycoside 6-adenylyltransferase
VWEVTQWAGTKADIRLSLIVGSRARCDHPADSWADLDIMTFTTNPKTYFSQTDWMTEMGNVWVKTRHHTATNEAEWLVTYEGGIDVDFVFSSYPKTCWQIMLWLTRNFPSLRRFIPRRVTHYLQRAAQTIRRGVRVLIDKDNIASSMLNFIGSFKSVPQPPTQTRFMELVEYFWCMAEKTAKKICRGELYVACSWCNYLQQTAVLPMLGQCIIKFAILKRKSHRDSEMVSCSKNKPKGVLPRWPTIRIP